jgi:hypothetical protein
MLAVKIKKKENVHELFLVEHREIIGIHHQKILLISVVHHRQQHVHIHVVKIKYVMEQLDVKIQIQNHVQRHDIVIMDVVSQSQHYQMEQVQE